MHLYIHVPFCARRCSYCDFAIAVRREVPSAAYVAAVRREWTAWQADEAWEASPWIDTIYLGGGTPSRLDPTALAGLLSAIRADRPVAPDAEITLEANPDDVNAGSAALWRAAGINRISLGAQSFDPAVLRWMHRTHDAGRIPAAVATLRGAGFDNLSLDLIFALPRSLGRDWAGDLNRALALEPEHLSLYGLTVEPHTPLGRWTARREITPIDDDTYATEFLHADAAVRAAGFDHYEVSNMARPGRRARHNSAYWARAPFIGLGPSAHSGFADRRRWNIREWAAYEAALAAGASALDDEETLAPAALRIEDLYLGLRTSDGIDPGWLPDATVARWVVAGWATAGDRVRLTAEGWLRLDALVASV